MTKIKTHRKYVTWWGFTISSTVSIYTCTYSCHTVSTILTGYSFTKILKQKSDKRESPNKTNCSTCASSVDDHFFTPLKMCVFFRSFHRKTRSSKKNKWVFHLWIWIMNLKLFTNFYSLFLNLVQFGIVMK